MATSCSSLAPSPSSSPLQSPSLPSSLLPSTTSSLPCTARALHTSAKSSLS